MEDEEKIVMSKSDHPDVLFEQAAIVERKYKHRNCKPTYNELFGRVILGAVDAYRPHMTSKIVSLQ